MKTTALATTALLLTALTVAAQPPQPMLPPQFPPMQPSQPQPSLNAPPPQYSAEPIPSAAYDAPARTPYGINTTLYGKPECYTSADVLIWQRRLPNGPLLINQYTGDTVANFRDQFRGIWGAGPNVTLGRPFTDCWSAEVNYFGLYNMTLTGATQVGRAQPVLPDQNVAGRLIAAEILPFPGFVVAGAPGLTFDPRDSSQVYSYITSLNNLELNLRKDVTDRFSWLIGFRYLNLTENLTGTLFDSVGNTQGNYTIGTKNNLFGGQVGADYYAPIADPLYLRISGKAGLFGNSASQNTFGSFLDVNAPNRFNAPAGRDASGGQASFVGQANLSAVYEVTPRFHIRAGYSALVITGIAAAPAQTTASSFAPGGRAGINTHENAFYHGMNFGIEYHH